MGSPSSSSRPAAGSSRVEQGPFSRHSGGAAAKEPAKLSGAAPAGPLLLISGSLSALAPPTCLPQPELLQPPCAPKTRVVGGDGAWSP